jgi:hypothetical protein
MNIEKHLKNYQASMASAQMNAAKSVVAQSIMDDIIKKMNKDTVAQLTRFEVKVLRSEGPDPSVTFVVNVGVQSEDPSLYSRSILFKDEGLMFTSMNTVEDFEGIREHTKEYWKDKEISSTETEDWAWKDVPKNIRNQVLDYFSLYLGMDFYWWHEELANLELLATVDVLPARNLHKL